MAKQQSNMVNARLNPAIKALNAGKNDDGTSLSEEDKRQYVQDIKNAMDIGFISGKETKVKSALASAMKTSSKKAHGGMVHRGRKAMRGAD